MNFTTAIRSLAVTAAAFCCLHVTAQTQTWPDKPVKLVVPYAPGGPTDLVARSMGTLLSQQLHQPVVVENRAGAGGVIGTGFVVNAPADGYTLLLGLQGPITINPALVKVPYDPFRDLVAVRMIATAPMVLMASKKSGVNKLADVTTQSKAKAAGLNIGSPGNGTLPHVAAELLKNKTGANLVHVPYKGAGPALADLTAGHIDLLFSDLQVGLPFIQSGQVTPLAVTIPVRSPKLPNLPTLAESGFGNNSLAGWYGIFAPKNTPAPVVARINQAVDGMFQDAAFKQLLESQGAQQSTADSAQFNKFLHDEYEQWSKLGKSISIKMD
ncbi:MAG: tripartite tricarboxylate transporter substrate binding protein [Pseudomonadota bacterium]